MERSFDLRICIFWYGRTVSGTHRVLHKRGRRRKVDVFYFRYLLCRRLKRIRWWGGFPFFFFFFLIKRPSSSSAEAEWHRASSAVHKTAGWGGVGGEREKQSIGVLSSKWPLHVTAADSELSKGSRLPLAGLIYIENTGERKRLGRPDVRRSRGICLKLIGHINQEMPFFHIDIKVK